MKKLIKSGALTAAFLSGGVVHAEPAFGVGVSYVFGGDFALGFRIFHDNEPDSAVLALGADYKFRSQSFRPTVGVGYLDEDYYLDFSLGYDTKSQSLDYGVGVGGAFETEEESGGSSPDTVPTTEF